MTTPINISLQDLVNLVLYNNKVHYHPNITHIVSALVWLCCVNINWNIDSFMQDQQFSCLANIDGIVNQDSWSYSACPECKVSAYCDGNPITCHNYQTIITSTIQWYVYIIPATRINYYNNVILHFLLSTSSNTTGTIQPF